MIRAWLRGPQVLRAARIAAARATLLTPLTDEQARVQVRLVSAQELERCLKDALPRGWPWKRWPSY